MAGSVFTYTGNANGRNTAGIQTSQGLVLVGQSGLFTGSEYQSAVGQGCVLVAGPAASPRLQLLYSPPVVAAGSAGNPNGAYLYCYTFVTAAGETLPGPETLITLTNEQGDLSQIPVGTTASGVIARKIYRTSAGGLSGAEKLVAEINDNLTTTYVDNVADGSLGASLPTSDTSYVLPRGAISEETEYATLTGNPPDDSYAIGAGTGRKIGSGGGSGTVESVTPSDDTIDVAGTDSNPTLAVGSSVVRTSDGSDAAQVDPASAYVDQSVRVFDQASGEDKGADLLALPAAGILSSTGTALADVTVGAGLTFTGGTLALAGSPGLTPHISTASETVVPPASATFVELEARGGGGGGGGAGSAASSATLQVGASGGGCGMAVKTLKSLSGVGSLVVVIGTGGTNGSGGAGGAGAPGTSGGQGVATTVTAKANADGTGSTIWTVTAYGGSFGLLSAANSTTQVAGGVPGAIGNNQSASGPSSGTFYTPPGAGGKSGSHGGGPSGFAGGGGGGAGAASASNGGGPGGAGTGPSTGQGGGAGGGGGGTSGGAGAVGTSASANSGAGGGGGGGGNNGQAGGNGGAGGSGQVDFRYF